jgi:hypothetical protein
VKAIVLTATTVVATLAALLSVPAKAENGAEAPVSKGILFEDRFERSGLGPHYEVMTPDPNRYALSDGKLVLVASEPVKNVVLLNKNLSGDFTATVEVNMRVMARNHVAMYYFVDNENYLMLGVGTSITCYPVAWAQRDCGWPSKVRQPFFTKSVGNEKNTIVMRIRELGTRSLGGFSEKGEPWYFQLRREGIKYTGQISVDGVRWTDLGTHVIVPKHGRLGMVAGSGGGAENAAEFGEFVVQE